MAADDPEGAAVEGCDCGAAARAAASESVDRFQRSLELRHEALRSSHQQLKDGIARTVEVNMRSYMESSRTSQAFANQSMATVAAWISSQTCFLAVRELLSGVENVDVRDLVSRLIYAVLLTFVVPSLEWAIRKHLVGATVISDQIRLLQLCLPLFFAWAWKDFVGAIISLKCDDHVFWPELLVAVAALAVVVACELTPCYRRSVQVAGGPDDSLLMRLCGMPKNLGLAAGYALNSVLSYPLTEVVRLTSTPMFILMLQVAYFSFVTFVITTAYQHWSMYNAKFEAGHIEGECCKSMNLEDPSNRPSGMSGDQSPTRPAFSSTTAEVGDDVLHQVGQNFMDALCFVYAWAQLDLANAFFFTYLMDCGGPTTCSYQSNIGFAAAATFIFARLSYMLKTERRIDQWNQAATVLTNRALSLNVGWAWSNYCDTAIANATLTSGVPKLWTYVICVVFVWMFISMVHRKSEIERRAWDRHVSEESLANGLGQTFFK